MVKTLERGAHMKRESIRFKKRSQITIPKEFVDALQLHEGDRLECRLEDGKIVIVPMVEVPKDQAWFWSEEWQKEEREVEQQLRDGRVSPPMNFEDTLAALDDLSKEK
ncbi:AbrB/MazE/SpoVT family DNA-binding domain-containing protein [Scopulibacillus daqui]|nr:AbrB/MazE/SpoVT family DNA-binding domain-containing protein [Scopulibacillus daqui]